MANPTDEEIEADPGASRARHVVRCRHFKLDPDKTTPAELRRVWDRHFFLAACKEAKLDPDTTSPEELSAAIARIRHGAQGYASEGSSAE